MSAKQEDICMLCYKEAPSILTCCKASICRVCLITSIIGSGKLSCPYCKNNISINDIYLLVPCQICNTEKETVNLCKTCKNLYLCDSCWNIIHHPKTPLINHIKYDQNDEDNLSERKELLEEQFTYQLSCLEDSKNYEQDLLDYMHKDKTDKFTQIKEIKEAFRRVRQTIDEQEKMLFDLIQEQTSIKRSYTQKMINQIEKNLENIKKTILTGNYHDITQLYFNMYYKNYLFNLPSITIGEQISIDHKLNYQKLVILESCVFTSNISGSVTIILIGGGGSGNYGNGGGSGEINVILYCLEKDKTYNLTVGKSDQITSFNDKFYAISGDQPKDTKYGGSGTCGGGVGASRKDESRGTCGGSLLNEEYHGVDNNSKIGGEGYGLSNTNYNIHTLKDKYTFILGGKSGEGGISDNSLRNGYPGGGGAGGLNVMGYPEPVVKINDHVYSGKIGTGFGAGGASYFDGENFINTEGKQGAIIICYV